MDRYLITAGALLALLAVALGAFGAHALDASLSAKAKGWFETAAHYHLTHSLGVILTGVCIRLYRDTASLRVAGLTLAGGIVFFSGSLYLMAITGLTSIAIVTPLGGLLFLLGWSSLAIGVYRLR